MYFDGDGVLPQDYVVAHKWFQLGGNTQRRVKSGRKRGAAARSEAEPRRCRRENVASANRRGAEARARVEVK